MSVKPLPGFVLVEIVEDDKVRQSGFVEPETAKDKPAKGIVLDVGDTDSPVSGGQKIVYKKWNSHSIKDKDTELVFIEYKDILGCYG